MTKLLAFSIASLAMHSVAFAMADEGNGGTGESTAPTGPTSLSILTDETKLESLGKVFASQRVLDTLELAMAHLESVAATTENFFGLPIAMTGLDDNGDPIPTVYEGVKVRVGTLAARIEVSKGKFKNGLKAVTVLPIPTIEQIMASPEGPAFIGKIIAKELSHVAYRNIRDAATTADLESGMAKAPQSVEDYLAESKRAGSAADTETFDALWKPLRASIKETLPALDKMLPNKVEVIKAIRSKSYAESEYPELENAPKGSVFVKLANATIANALANEDKAGKPAPLDSTAITDWLESRDTVKLTKRGEQPVDYSAIGEIDFGGFGAPVTSTDTTEQNDSAA